MTRRHDKRLRWLENRARHLAPDSGAVYGRMLAKGEWLASIRNSPDAVDPAMAPTMDLVCEFCAAVPNPSPVLLEELERRIENRDNLSESDRRWLWIVAGVAETVAARAEGRNLDLDATKAAYYRS